MKSFIILLGVISFSLNLNAQQCGQVYNDHVSSHFAAADLQVATFYADAICQAYNYIDAGMATPPDYNDSERIQTLNDEAWTTIMTANKVNTTFSSKSSLKTVFVDGQVSRGVARCIAEIDDMAFQAADYEAFLEDLIRLVLNHFFLTLSPQEQAQVSTYAVLIDYVYQFANTKVQGIKGKDNPLKANWWSSWGRCVAGTLGSALGGGLAGAAVGAGAAGLGAIPGAILGGIGGASAGAAEYCG
ncbi:MAG: hypothetical protein AAF502_19590 [Bacteroidota bacterium]